MHGARSGLTSGLPITDNNTLNDVRVETAAARFTAQRSIGDDDNGSMATPLHNLSRSLCTLYPVQVLIVTFLATIFML